MARYRRSQAHRLLTIVVVLAILGIRWWSSQEPFGADTPRDRPGAEQGQSANALQARDYDVIRVVDGDTLILGKQKVKVRLQGVDAPETVKENWPVEPWGPEASQFTRQFVADAGGILRVEIDGESRDKYGRALGFLWHDDRMLNEELVRNGLARAKLGYDYSQSKKNVLKQAEREAQRARRGIWSSR